MIRRLFLSLAAALMFGTVAMATLQAAEPAPPPVLMDEPLATCAPPSQEQPDVDDNPQGIGTPLDTAAIA